MIECELNVTQYILFNSIQDIGHVTTIRQTTKKKKKTQLLTPSSVSHLFGTMLLDTAVDVTESGSGQHVGRLLVDQSVKVSLDLENVGERGLKSFFRACDVGPMVLVVNGKPPLLLIMKLSPQLLCRSLTKDALKIVPYEAHLDMNNT